jgi:hypothetical protein
MEKDLLCSLYLKKQKYSYRQLVENVVDYKGCVSLL